jgi:HK97 family phage prohead protease
MTTIDTLELVSEETLVVPNGDADIQVGDEFTAGFNVEIVATEVSEDGSIGHVDALVSVYNLPYRMGFLTKHLIKPGAFAKSIAEQPVVPLFFQHNWNWSEQPPIGTGEATETNTGKKPGLKIAGDFFLDTEAGRSVFNAIKAKALRQWSIGYRIAKFMVEEDEDSGMDIVHVEEADLLEASSVLRGANPGTETLKVASEVAALDAMSSALEALSTQMELQVSLNQVLIERIDVIEALNQALIARIDHIEDALANIPEHTHEDATSAKSGEEASEPVAQGVGEAPAGAAPAVPQVPAFLPPSDADDDIDRNNVSDITRVMRAWGRVEREAEVKSLIANR